MDKELKIYDYEVIELKIPENSTFLDINMYYEEWLKQRLLCAGFDFKKIITKYEMIGENYMLFKQKGDDNGIC